MHPIRRPVPVADEFDPSASRPKLKRAAVLAAVVALGFTGGVAGPGVPEARAAEMGNSIQYGNSTAPFWQVGDPNVELTKLCRRGQFNQRKHEEFYIGYHGVENPGRGYTGIAKQNYNLIDPTGQAEPNITYHFFNDGYSNCKVYAAPDPVPEGGQ